MGSRLRPAELASRAQRRERIEALLLDDPTASNGRIAAEAFSDRKTVAQFRGDLERAARIPERTRPVPTDHGGALLPAEPGNTRALKHGAFSAGTLAPRIEQLASEISAVVVGYEPADQLAVRALATATAQAETLTAYLNEHGTVTRKGDVQNAARLLQTALSGMAKWCDSLGLTPASRRRLGMMRSPGETREESMVLRMAREATEARETWQNGGGS